MDLKFSGGKSPEGSLLGNRVISSHLKALGYPEKSILSMNRCQEETGDFVYSYCDCGSRDKIHPLKYCCSLRTCPDCSQKRKRSLRRKYLKSLISLPQTRLNFLYFLTISPPNYKNLAFGLLDIRKNFRKFLRLNYIKNRLSGSIYVLEVKQNSETGFWNIHIHAIVYGRYLDNKLRGRCLECGQNLISFDYLSKKYYCSSRRCGSLNVVVKKNSKIVDLWCSNFKQDVNIHISRQNKHNFFHNDPLFTLNYMLKYISCNKDEFNSDFDFAQYIFSTRKKRLISTTGFFYNYNFGSKKHYHCPDCGSLVKYINCFEYLSLKTRASSFNYVYFPPPNVEPPKKMT